MASQYAGVLAWSRDADPALGDGSPTICISKELLKIDCAGIGGGCMTKKSEEMIQAIAAIHAAHTNALVVLVKTLQEAGVVDPTHFATNIRMTIEAHNSRIGPDVQGLLLELAKLMEMEDDAGTA